MSAVGDPMPTRFDRIRAVLPIAGCETILEHLVMFKKDRSWVQAEKLRLMIGVNRFPAVELEDLAWLEGKVEKREAEAARILLWRESYDTLWSNGWRTFKDLAGGISSWEMVFRRAGEPNSVQQQVEVVWQRIKDAEPPYRWRPESPDDPILVQAFEGLSFRPNTPLG